MNGLGRLMVLTVAAFFILMSCGCSTREKPTHTVRFFLERGNSLGTPPAWSREIEMPNSGLSFTVHRSPIILERNVVDVDLVRVSSGDLAVVFYLDDEGSKELYRRSVADNGSRVVTVINDVPFGARKLDGTIIDGKFFTFSELDEEALKELVPLLKKNAEIIQKIKNKKFL